MPTVGLSSTQLHWLIKLKIKHSHTTCILPMFPIVECARGLMPFVLQCALYATKRQLEYYWRLILFSCKFKNKVIRGCSKIYVNMFLVISYPSTSPLPSSWLRKIYEFLSLFSRRKIFLFCKLSKLHLTINENS